MKYRESRVVLNDRLCRVVQIGMARQARPGLLRGVIETSSIRFGLCGGGYVDRCG